LTYVCAAGLRLLVSKGAKGGAYVVVLPRRQTGKPIYEGTLESGQGHRFVGHRLWSTFRTGGT